MFSKHIYNLSSGKRFSIKKIIEIIKKLFTKKVNAKFSNNTPDEKCIWANNSKANKKLNFSPTVSLTDGLFLTIIFFYDDYSVFFIYNFFKKLNYVKCTQE